MTTEGICRDVRERLTEALLARRPAQSGDETHAEGCADCAAVRAELRTLARALPRIEVPELAPGRALAQRRSAVDELGVSLPNGFRRELARLIAWAALPLPAIALWYAERLKAALPP